MSDIRQTRDWAHYLKEFGWGVERIGKHYAYVKTFPIIGSYIKIPRFSWPIDLKEIDRVVKKHNAFLVKLEPKIELDSKISQTVDEELLSSGFIKDYLSLTIAKTRIVELNKNTFNQFGKYTRRSIRRAEKSGVKIKISEDIDFFYKFYQKHAKEIKAPVMPYKKLSAIYNTFKATKKAAILLAILNSQIVSGCIIIFNKEEKTVSHLVAATDRTISTASYSLTWDAMEYSRRLGYKFFDFEGIQDKKYFAMRDWGGFTEFKRRFGGKEAGYIGSYLKIRNPILNKLLGLFLPKVKSQ